MQLQSTAPLRISLPLIPCRYYLPSDLPAPVGLEKRAITRPRIGDRRPSKPPDRKRGGARDLAEVCRINSRRAAVGRTPTFSAKSCQ
jgi:hypothetical protein